MPCLLISHPACLDHDTGPAHPERPDRLRAVMAALDAARFPALVRHDAPRARPEQVGRVHDAAHVEAILTLSVPAGELAALDADTIVSPGSVEAALRAAGGAVDAIDRVMQGQGPRAFVAVRPPGHHATPDRAMGFCLFNSVAIAAAHAREQWGIERVCVADFDVHHGNGTQDAFWSAPGLFFASSHQSPCYPGTGEAWARGAVGTIANAPLPPGAGGAEFRAAWERDLLPALDAFAPQLVLVSAGFDAHRADPLAQLMLDETDYGWLTGELVVLANRHAQGRIVSLLEGGYDLAALAASAAAHVHVLCTAD